MGGGVPFASGLRRIMHLAATLIDVFCSVLILDVALSWFIRNPRNQLRLLLGKLTNPVLDPIRKLVPTPGLDFSAMIVIIALQAIRRGLV